MATNLNQDSPKRPLSDPAVPTESRKKKKRQKLATVSVTASGEAGVKLKELQRCILHKLVNGNHSDIVTVKGTIKRAVVLQVEGLDLATYLKQSSSFSEFKLFPQAHQLKLPGNNQFVHDCSKSFLSSPMSKAQINLRKKHLPTATVQISSLLVTPQQRKLNDYPDPQLLQEAAKNGYIKLPSAKHEKHIAMVAIDCEMVLTKAGEKELARISVVDPQGNVLMDELVKPPNEIVDYLTQYSGLTEEKLSPVTTTLSTIHTKLKALLSEHTIIIGHSLENDLIALKVCHEHVIDTVLAYKGDDSRRRKQSLKALTEQYLGRKIQAASDGHDSKEDAVAAMDLVLELLTQPKVVVDTMSTEESLCVRLGRCNKTSMLAGSAMVCQAHDTATRTRLHTTAEDEEANNVLRGEIERTDAADFMWTQFNSIQKENPTAEACTEINTYITQTREKIAQTFPDTTTLFCILGVPNRTRMVEKFKLRKASKQHPDTTPWTDADQSELIQVVAQAKQGLLFLTAV